MTKLAEVVGMPVEPGSHAIDPALLTTIPLLRQAPPAARRILLSRGSLREFAPGDVLWRAGAQPGGLFLLLRGEVRVVRTLGTRTHVVHVETAGGTLGEVPLFAGGGYPATAIASRRTTCLVLDRDALLGAIRVEPEFAFALLQPLARRLREVIARLDRVAGQPVVARVAEHMLRRGDALGAGTFTLGGTQRELAEELGTAREVVVRCLAELRRDGSIERAGRGRWRIVDRAKLATAAGK